MNAATRHESSSENNHVGAEFIRHLIVT